MTKDEVIRLVERYAGARVAAELAYARDASEAVMRSSHARTVDARAAVSAGLDAFEEAATIRIADERPF